MDIPSIVLASCGRKELLTLSTSHDLVSLSSNQETLFDSTGIHGLTTLKESGIGNHLYFQISICSPLPTTHVDPKTTTSLAAIMLHQAYEGLLPNIASLKGLSAKYLALNTLCTREVGFYWILQPCFARRGRLNTLKSLKPIPPSSFGIQSSSHAIHAIFLSLSFCPHQKLLIMAFNSLQS